MDMGWVHPWVRLGWVGSGWVERSIILKSPIPGIGDFKIIERYHQ